MITLNEIVVLLFGVTAVLAAVFYYYRQKKVAKTVQVIVEGEATKVIRKKKEQE